MGDLRKGVEVRERSIRLRFTWQGKAQWPTLMTAGKPMLPTPKNIRYAESLVAEIRERIRHGTFVWAEYFDAGGDTGTGLSFGSQLDTWLKAQRIEYSTRAGYTSAIKFWKGAIVDGAPFGEKLLRAVKPSDFMLALATRPLLSGKTVNNYVSVAREALALAVVDQLLPANPAEAIKRAPHQKEPPDPFTLEECELIVADMHTRAPAAVANLVETWFWTGMRTSEAAGLKWPRVDLASGTMLVSEALVRGQAKAKTKTARARTVRLNSRALEALKRQKAHTFLAGEHVFLDPRYGTPWVEERAFRRSYWEPCLKRLGLRYRRPYQMRHTYATQMLMAGMNPAFAARQLGHSVEVFLSTYAKWIDGERDGAEMARIEGVLTRALPGKAAEA